MAFVVRLHIEMWEWFQPLVWELLMKIYDRLLVLWPCFAISSIFLPQTARAANEPKAKYASPIISSQTPGHAVEINADITGAKQLYLVVTDADDSFACDWADWAEPRLVGPSGEKKLTEMRWKSASAQWGAVHVDRNANDEPMRIDGKPVSYGIGTHANSLIVFDLPAGYTHFKARGGLDNGGTDQGNPSPSSVRFLVFTERPPADFMAKFAETSPQPAGGIDHDPAKATSYLDVADGLEVTLFASEPMMTNPTDIDIDARGRVWICDVQNYRGHSGQRPDGDRILILEDTKGDGQADKATTFYQGRDVDSALGICVLGNRVIVSCSPNVFVFTNDDHDNAAKKEVLFTKPGQPQHDHGAHAFVFGPDGKLYWNFGNAGQRVHDKNGKPIVDLAGNAVDDSGKPYRQGMVFRCDLDGSHFEVLAHNFRNNYEVAVDSLRHALAIGQRRRRQPRRAHQLRHGVRQLRLHRRDDRRRLEHANLGQPDDIPTRHWHQNDPGRRAESAADRRRLADRHSRLRRQSAAQGLPRPDDSLRRRARTSSARIR